MLQDAAGHHSSALFVQWVPYKLAGTTWEEEEEKYVQHLINIVDDFAPGECPKPALAAYLRALSADTILDVELMAMPSVEMMCVWLWGKAHGNGSAVSRDQPLRLPLLCMKCCAPVPAA